MEKTNNMTRQRLLELAGDNRGEVEAFLDRDADPLRLLLLSTLRAADLARADAPLLETHLERARPWAGRYPAEVFRRFVLCPWVGEEPLTDWSGLPGGPAGQVMALRRSGVPACLRPLDGAVLVWREGKFVPREPEECGKVVFWRMPDQRPAYQKDWVLEQWTGSAWKTLHLTDRAWRKGKLTAALPRGRYRMRTWVSEPFGLLRTGGQEFTVEAGRTLDLSLRMPEEGD